MTTPEMNGEWRILIDARLDQIERVLLRVDVSYSERRHIVGEVETQIFELLARRTENPTREDVQAVLDSLDPAEAYIPEELREKFTEAAAGNGPTVKRPSGPRMSRLAVGSAAVAAGLLLVGAFALFEHPNEHEVALFFGTPLFLATICGFVACARILLSGGQLRGLPFALFAAGLVPLILVNFVFVVLIAAMGWAVPILLTVAGIVYLNYLGIRRLWRWVSERKTQLAALLRAALSRANPAGSEARST